MEYLKDTELGVFFELMNGYLGRFPQGIYVVRVLMRILNWLRSSWLTPEKSLICLLLVRRAGAGIHPSLPSIKESTSAGNQPLSEMCSLWDLPGSHSSSTRGEIKAKISKPLLRILQRIWGQQPPELERAIWQCSRAQGLDVSTILRWWASYGFFENH